MARQSKPTFILRADVDTNDTSQAQQTMDVSNFINIPKGQVLLIKRAWINFCNSSDGHGVVASAFASSSGLCVSATATSKTFSTMQPSSEPSLIAKSYLHMHGDSGSDTTMYQETALLDPANFEDGFFCASNHISLTVDSSLALNPEITVSFVFECQSVNINKAEALAKIVSLTT